MTLTEKAVALIAYLDRNAKPDITPQDRISIAELLTQSRAQHLIYRRALKHRVNGVMIDGDPTAAAEALAHSARLRAEAEISDPKHADSSWADDLTAKFPHEALIGFYETEIPTVLPQLKAAASVVDEPDDAPPVVGPKPSEQQAQNANAK